MELTREIYSDRKQHDSLSCLVLQQTTDFQYFYLLCVIKRSNFQQLYHISIALSRAPVNASS